MTADRITVHAPAKINIFLEITGKRQDGYHNISSIFCLIKLSDELHFEKIKNAEGVIDFFCDAKELNSKDNIVVKAARKILETARSKDGLKITLKKKIPWGAGLGGGSSDAAATIVAVNKIFNLKLPNEKLMQIGLSLGADVPFFLSSTTCAFVEGIGEKIHPLEPFWLKNNKPITLLVVKPEFSISTKEAYSRIRFPLTDIRQIDRIIDEIKGRKKILFENIAPLLFNRFEEILDDNLRANISEIKKILVGNCAGAALMSGSGSTVVGFFTDHRKAHLAQKDIKKKSPAACETFITAFHPCHNSGVV